jgi:hypothetical protein
VGAMISPGLRREVHRITISARMLGFFADLEEMTR